MKVEVLRLRPGQDLKQALWDWTRDRRPSAACLLSTVGSLDTIDLRLAGGDRRLRREGPHEILSLSGTLCLDGLHLHLAIADATGQVWGGHLLDGCRIFTTAELVLGILPGWQFERQRDAQTGYPELEAKRL
ncbi:PPC domain-containing DNA-binding protein [Synechococcus elongatus]|uniref:PPC domain-containing DNA-binding protein n=1 Tax=Synechococcus elongatus TaxID=32046 RepID=UPI000F7F29B5|nr:PPC domain-containing DNA-binding protein [Synechococcus elongatus]